MNGREGSKFFFFFFGKGGGGFERRKTGGHENFERWININYQMREREREASLSYLPNLLKSALQVLTYIPNLFEKNSYEKKDTFPR